MVGDSTAGLNGSAFAMMSFGPVNAPSAIRGQYGPRVLRKSKTSLASLSPPTLGRHKKLNVIVHSSRSSVNRAGWPAQDSLRFHARCFHHRGPARNFRRDKIREILRRANSVFEAELFHAGDHLGGLQRLVDRCVGLVDDGGGVGAGAPSPARDV